jgi:hypothetical protein
MITRRHQRHRQGRRATAAVELAVLLPFLAFMFVLAIDYGRIFFYAMTVENCARTGAYFASDYPGIYSYGSVENAALSDATNLSPSPKVATGYDAGSDGAFTGTSPATDSRGYQTGFVKVTVNWQFQTIVNYPLIPTTVNLSRSVVMRMAPIIP